MTVLLLSIVAHIMADFVFQSEKVAAGKVRLKIAGIVIHGVTVLGTLLVLLAGYELFTVVIFAGLITISHLLVDIIKIICFKASDKSRDLVGFLLDQAVHLGLIFLIWQTFDFQPNPVLAGIGNWILPAKAVAKLQPHLLVVQPVLTWNQFLVGAIVYGYVCFGGIFLIGKMLDWLKKGDRLAVMGRSGMDRTGRWIGIIERLMVMTMVVSDALGAVAFILTAKSIARFNELNDRKFAEYYLVGTLSSTALAICGGFILSYLLKIIH